MDSYTLIVSPAASSTRLLLRHGPDELLRAILPPPLHVRHARAAMTLIEGLSLWVDTRLPVVLSVDAEQASDCLGLADELGVGTHSVYCRVDVVERGRRRLGYRIRGVGDFSDLRQLWLLP